MHQPRPSISSYHSPLGLRMHDTRQLNDSFFEGERAVISLNIYMDTKILPDLRNVRL